LSSQCTVSPETKRASILILMEGGIQRLSSQRGRSTVGIGPIAVLGHIRRLAIKNNPIQAKPRFETTAQLTVDSPSNIVCPQPCARRHTVFNINWKLCFLPSGQPYRNALYSLEPFRRDSKIHSHQIPAYFLSSGVNRDPCFE